MAHHLLLADDSVTIQRVIKLTFADEDVEVVTVGDGNQAVASIDRQPPDIVLADVAMPGRTGYEVAQHIRTSPKLAHIPVLLLTGAFEPIDEARASEVGCDGVLAKPFEPDVVVSRVKELLARPRSAAAVRPAVRTAHAASPGPMTAIAVEAPPVPPVFSMPTAPPRPTPVVEIIAPTAKAPASALVPMPFPAPSAPATLHMGTSGAPITPLVFPTGEPVKFGPPPVEDPITPVRQSPAEVDAYFDRLDQAFAALALAPRTPTPIEPEPSAPSPWSTSPFAVTPAVPEPAASVPPIDMPVAPLVPLAPLAALAAAMPEPLAVLESPPAIAAAAASPDAPPVTLPTESWPAVASAPADGSHAISDDQLEAIVTRVLERLDARIGNLADVVASVAERVVREEIEQIKKRV